MERKPNLILGLKLWLNILFSILASNIILICFSAMLFDTAGIVILQILCLLVLTAAVYSHLWQVGAKDINYIKCCVIKDDKLTGLKIGAVGCTVIYIIDILLVVAKMLNNQLIYKIYGLLTNEFIALVKLLPANASDLTWGSIALMLLAPLYVVAVGVIAYCLGRKRVSLISKLVYKNKKAK